jgi:hypothetical protein
MALDDTMDTGEATQDLGADPGKTMIAPPDTDKTAVVGAVAGATQVVAPITCPVCSTSNGPGTMYCVDCGFLLSSAPGDVAAAPSADELTRLVNAANPVEEYPLHSGANSVGRENADVLLTDATVSRHHATVTMENGGVSVTDLGSTNGTTVNGRTMRSCSDAWRCG